MADQPTSALLTRADLDDFPDDGQRYELVDGVLLVSPLARLRHQRVVGRITYRLVAWAEEHHGTVYPGANVDLAEDTHLEPDLVWTPLEDPDGLGFDHTPDFIAEVASPWTRRFDRAIKKDRYAASGCREFWIVDLDAGVIEVFTVTEGHAGDPVTHAAGDTFTSPLFPGLTFDVDDLLGHRR